MANGADMSGGHLHAVVDAIATAGSRTLARHAAAGTPVPFDLIEVPSTNGGGPSFTYQPRTREFVDDHAPLLRELPEWPAAMRVLAPLDGITEYLASHGEVNPPVDDQARADLALRVLLASMHAETGDFLHTPGRTAAASADLARFVLSARTPSMVAVSILGLVLESERIELAHGLTLVRDDQLPDLPDEARSSVPGRPGTIALVETVEDPAGASSVALARPRVRALLTALRLYDHPAPALAPVAWSRVGKGPWLSHPLVGVAARASGTLQLPAAHAEALRGFADLVSTGHRLTGAAAWATRRFELACERADHGEALTDVLLGLRALLSEPHEDPALLGERLAALCARPADRDSLRNRVQIAQSLEVALMHGEAGDQGQLREAVVELRGHLRALLRDVACGHLPHDLVSVAERQLAAEAAPAAPSVPEELLAEEPLPPAAPIAWEEPQEAAPFAGFEDLAAEAGIEPAPRSAEPAVSWSAAAPSSGIFDGEAIADELLDPVAAFDASFDTVDEPEESVGPAAPVAPVAQAEPAVVAEAAAPEVEPRVVDQREVSEGESAVLSVKPMERKAEAPTPAPAPEPEPRVIPTLEEREHLPTGERFEDAFVRSLTEGPSAISGGSRGRRWSRR